MKSEKETFTLEVQYNQESKDNDLIKITPKTLDPIVLSSDELLEIIAHYAKKKEIALSLLSADVSQIAMCEVERTFFFTAGEDYKKGDTATFNVKQVLPVVLAILEEEYKRAIITSEWVAIDQGRIESAVKHLSEGNRDFFKKVNRIEDTKVEENKN